MTAFASGIGGAIDAHARLIVGVLSGVVLFVLLACVFNDAIPVCHYIFGCDHRMH
jgi:hypothetical protein